MHALIRNSAQNGKVMKLYIVHFGFTVRYGDNNGTALFSQFKRDQTRLCVARNLRITLTVFHLPRRFRALQTVRGSVDTNARVVFVCVVCCSFVSCVCSV